METLIDTTEINTYLNEIQSLRACPTPTPLTVSSAIEHRYLQAIDGEWNALFEAEKLFYSGRYDEALAGYMKARNIPLFEFFCYRATAFVSHERQKLEKALNFIDKTLALRSNDYETLKLKATILAEKGDSEASIVRLQIAQIENENTPSYENEETLTEIFTPPSVKQQEGGALESYLDAAHSRRQQEDHVCVLLNGWRSGRTSKEKTPFEKILQEHVKPSLGGYFFRWNGKGIVLNPQEQFLELFHAEGFFIDDIDTVIATTTTLETQKEIERIYNLNHELNQIRPEHHPIHYYLNAQMSQQMARLLRPRVKQERGTVHSLELFDDSIDGETLSLGRDLSLRFFSATLSTAENPPIGLILNFGNQRSVGYVGAIGWSPTLSTHYTGCDLILSSFGATDPNDFEKLQHLPHHLGYYGTFSLLQETEPKLFICTEFDGKEGDVRLEAVRKLRKETGKQTIIPAEIGLRIDLNNLKVSPKKGQPFISGEELFIARELGEYGALTYFSQNQIL